jgi:hypothetical protein
MVRSESLGEKDAEMLLFKAQAAENPFLRIIYNDISRHEDLLVDKFAHTTPDVANGMVNIVE